MITRILMERETIERSEFEALLEGVPEEEVFREKDEREAQARQGGQAARARRQRASTPPVAGRRAPSTRRRPSPPDAAAGGDLPWITPRSKKESA